MRVTQQAGSVLLSIDPASMRDTEVVTPHLAAVVIGTVLEVTTNGSGSEVRVDEGRVQVEGAGGQAIVTAGQQAAVAANGGQSIVVSLATETSLGGPGHSLSGPFGQPRQLDVPTGPANGNGGGNGNGNGNGGGNGNGNGGGNGNGNGNGNGGGNGNGNGGGNGNGNGNGNG